MEDKDVFQPFSTAGPEQHRAIAADVAFMATVNQSSIYFQTDDRKMKTKVSQVRVATNVY